MQTVVIEAILFVPEGLVVGTEMVDRLGDVEEILHELRGHGLIRRILSGQLERNAEQVEAVHRHPGRSVRLVNIAAHARGNVAAVEDADVVEPDKTALENIVADLIFTIHPPGEVRRELSKHSLQKLAVTFAVHLPFNLEEAPRGPGLDRWIKVVEGPLGRGHLPVRVQVPLAGQQQQLAFRELVIDHRQGDRMERQVPGSEPRILPVVRHGDHFVGMEVEPAAVATGSASMRGGGPAASPFNQSRMIVAVVLLIPQQAGKGLTLEFRMSSGIGNGVTAGVKVVGLALPLLDDATASATNGVAIRGASLTEQDRRRAPDSRSSGSAPRLSCRCSPG